jgi:hypothetical protein
LNVKVLPIPAVLLAGAIVITPSPGAACTTVVAVSGPTATAVASRMPNLRRTDEPPESQTPGRVGCSYHDWSPRVTRNQCCVGLSSDLYRTAALGSPMASSPRGPTVSLPRNLLRDVTSSS